MAGQETLWAWRYEFALGVSAPRDSSPVDILGSPGPWFFAGFTGYYQGDPVMVWARERSTGATLDKATGKPSP